MHIRSRCIVPLISFLALLGCATATTKIISSSKAGGYQGTVRNVLVVGIAGTLEARHRFESEFVRNLEDHKLTAYPSYGVFPSTGIPGRDEIAAIVRERGIDTILVTRFVDQKETTTYVPGSYDYISAPYPDAEFYGYYESGNSYVTTPGYTVENRSVVLRTNLYAAANQKLFWTAATNTTTQGDNAAIVKSFIKTIIKQMEDDGLLLKP